ncbi:DUF4386 domain-containing protein [Cohnella rhizosphaerae]|uniref:DUF4386 domain-containing protein n=1 Tax=Cohnella rhizosphaerae TaxID=1457232 RepID=A0A9X4KS75_9BACL|nr:DUF4386 domain-containing protein [Cohnella rhizosphaerae]MDG0809266.1 DUF4386 domain-containing protein [Cohnella rhizosphaerae]
MEKTQQSKYSSTLASKMAGIFFILAAASSIAGLLLYDPILNGADDLAQGAAHGDQVILGAVMELILVVSAVGTSITMFPYLRKYNQTLALGHVCFRFMEAVIIVIGIVGVLSLLTLSRSFAGAAAPDAAAYEASGVLLKAIHDWTFLLGPNFMLGVNTMLYSYIFYKSGLVPRFIPILGMTGAAAVFAAALFEMFGVFEQLSVWGALLSLPVAANEMTLAVWLIAKGFSRSPRIPALKAA